MKKFILAILIMFLVFNQSTIFSQSCLPNGIEFYSQDEIDNFQTNFPGCTEIEGDVWIDRGNINNLNGLSVLTSIGGNLFIYFLYQLTSLEGLNSLTSIGGVFMLNYIPHVTSLSPLYSLTSIGGELRVNSMDSLSSLLGLDNIDPNSITLLQITGNSCLSTCEVQSICDYLSSPGGTININNNAVGCNSQAEVEDACLSSVENIISEDKFSIFPNPANKTLTISIKNNEVLEEIVIYNQFGQKLQQMKPANNTIDVSKIQQGIYIIEVVSMQWRIRKKIIIE